MTDISETAYLVALCRAIETERPKPLFQDPWARRLAGSKAALYLAVLGDIRAIATALAIRTHVIDKILTQTIQHNCIDTVLNLGAGLDTRPYRLKLPASLTWIEVDLPNILVYKENILNYEQPLCDLQRIKLDLVDLEARQNLFAQINNEHGRVLVLSEGILGYLTEAQVAALAIDLHQQPNFQGWLLEFTAQSLLEQVQKQHSQKIFSQYFTNKNEAFSFAPSQGLAFFQPYGWQVTEFRSTWEETRRCNRASQWARLQELLIRAFAKENWQSFKHKSGVALMDRSHL
jgi:methyltransferase (TIGR00027 family)